MKYLCARSIKWLSMQILTFDNSGFEFCLISPITSSAPLRKSLNLMSVESSSLVNRDNNGALSFTGLLGRFNEIMHVEH